MPYSRSQESGGSGEEKNEGLSVLIPHTKGNYLQCIVYSVCNKVCNVSILLQIKYRSHEISLLNYITKEKLRAESTQRVRSNTEENVDTDALLKPFTLIDFEFE